MVYRIYFFDLALIKYYNDNLQNYCFLLNYKARYFYWFNSINKFMCIKVIYFIFSI